MIAYNRTELDNKWIREQAKDALDAGCISHEENTRIEAAHPVNFYTPNIFICVGLFLLTAFIVLCSTGLLMLLTMGGSDSMTFILIFSGGAAYAGLEFIVRNRRHYRSGVDLGLIWMSALLFFSAIYTSGHQISGVAICFILLFISLLFAVRFVNRTMSLVAYAALLALFINTMEGAGRAAQMITPFMLMTVSVIAFWAIKKIHPIERVRNYRSCLMVLKAATLISFYGAGNYFVVRELGNYMLGIFQLPGTGLPMGWLFWLFTIAIPFLYIWQGIRNKDSIFLWTGMALIPCTIFTIRFYYHILPVEWAMIAGGLLLIVIAYGLIKYLKTPRHGFSSLESNKKYMLENLQIESLVIAKTFKGTGTAPPPNHDFKFGGGSGGGGGAGGIY